MLTDRQKELLTRVLLDECWHTVEFLTGEESGIIYGTYCTKCRKEFKNPIIKNQNRPFDNWDDFGALWTAIQKRKDNKDFHDFCARKWINTDDDNSFFGYYLVDPERYPRLAAEWLEQAKPQTQAQTQASCNAG